MVHEKILNRGRIALPHLPGHGEERRQAVEEGRRRAEGHQRVHVGAPVQERAESPGEELPVHEKDNGGENELHDAHADAVLQEERNGEAPSHMPEGEVHQGKEHGERAEEAPEKLRRLAVLQRVLLRCGTFCCSASLWRGAVARILHSLHDVAHCRSSLNLHGVSEEAHRARGDAGDCPHRLFDMCLAGGAAHSGDSVSFHLFSSPGRQRLPEEMPFIS